MEYCDDEEDVTSLCLGTGARTGSRKMRFMLKMRMLMILRMADILTEVGEKLATGDWGENRDWREGVTSLLG